MRKLGVMPVYSGEKGGVPMTNRISNPEGYYGLHLIFALGAAVLLAVVVLENPEVLAYYPLGSNLTLALGALLVAAGFSGLELRRASRAATEGRAWGGPALTGAVFWPLWAGVFFTALAVLALALGPLPA